jgi:hypothetical protein
MPNHLAGFARRKKISATDVAKVVSVKKKRKERAWRGSRF